MTSPTNPTPHERAVLLRAAAQVEQACERPWITAQRDRIEASVWAVVKVEAA